MEKVWVSRWVPETELGEEFGLREAVSPQETRQEAAVTSEQGLLGPGQRHWEWAMEDGMGESVEESGKATVGWGNTGGAGVTVTQGTAQWPGGRDGSSLLSLQQKR